MTTRQNTFNFTSEEIAQAIAMALESLHQAKTTTKVVAPAKKASKKPTTKVVAPESKAKKSTTKVVETKKLSQAQKDAIAKGKKEKQAYDARKADLQSKINKLSWAKAVKNEKLIAIRRKELQGAIKATDINTHIDAKNNKICIGIYTFDNKCVKGKWALLAPIDLNPIEK